MTATASYVGNKGTHTYVRDLDMYTFPNAAQAILPASQSVIGQTLYYDTSVGSTPANPINANYPDIALNGHTSNTNYLRPYYAQYGWSQDVYYNAMAGDTHYNALQVTLEKRISHGLSITGNYAYQIARNYDSGGFYPDKKITYGPTDMNFDQVATIFGSYKLPFGREGDYFKDVPKWVDALIGGYQVTPSINISSGQPFTIVYTLCSSVFPQVTGSSDIRAENAEQPCTPNQSGSFPMKLTKYNPTSHSRSYFTPVSTPVFGFLIPGAAPSAGPFSVPAPDTVGNAGRNSYTGPGSWNADIAATKSVAIHENWSAQFRVDAFNAFNHISPSAPTPFYPQFGLQAYIDNPYIGGQIYNQALGQSPRQLDFALKIQF